MDHIMPVCPTSLFLWNRFCCLQRRVGDHCSSLFLSFRPIIHKEHNRGGTKKYTGMGGELNSYGVTFWFSTLAYI